MKTHLDLFSGIGGFALAASWAGYQTVGFCEIEDYPRRILSKRFSGVPIHRDVRELDGEQYRGVTLITGGYPCQPFSHAGKRKGTEDDRHLWPEMFRIIAQARPAWVLAENVAGHITMGLDEVLADLESEGYSGRTLVVPACAKNAPHRRDRVWIIAKRIYDAHSVHNRSTEQERQHERPQDSDRGISDQLESRSDVGNANSSGMEGPRSKQQAARSSRAGKDVAHTEQQGLQGYVEQQAEPSDASAGCSKDTDVANTEVERTQGLWSGGVEESSAYAGQEVPLCSYERIGSSYWQTEPNVGRVADGVSNRVDRLRGLGNAIVPQVAYEIIRELGA